MLEGTSFQATLHYKHRKNILARVFTFSTFSKRGIGAIVFFIADVRIRFIIELSTCDRVNVKRITDIFDLFGFAYRRRKSVHRLVCFVSSNSQLLNCRSFRELCGRPSKLIISYFHWIAFVYNSMHSSFESTWHKHSWRLTGRDKQKLCGWSFSLLRIVFKKNIHS